MVAGRTVERDREAEFRASGPVEALIERVVAARARLAADLVRIDASAPPRAAVARGDGALPLARSQGAVAVHIYEELTQHLGQMEITRDLVAAR